MTEPTAPPPTGPDPGQPTVAPQYSVPVQATDRWLGRAAPYYGVGAGAVLYLIGYLLTAFLALRESDVEARQVTAFFMAIFSGGIATVVVLITAIVLLANRRTRAFGVGLAISLPIGVVAGVVCTALIFASSV